MTTQHYSAGSTEYPLPALMPLSRHRKSKKEMFMFARSVTMRLKPNAVAEFNKTFEKEILPLLQKQKGFRDALALISSNGSEVLGIGFWDQRQDAEAYNRSAYQDVQKMLSKVIEGTPQVQTYEVSHSTVNKMAAHTA
jgi:quinol monooxygenase YgiN